MTLLTSNSTQYGLFFTQPIIIVKRDGNIVEFDVTKIKSALERCYLNSNLQPKIDISVLVDEVVNVISAGLPTTPTVEEVQDAVEVVLQSKGEYAAAKSYILYREEKRKLREHKPIPVDVRQAFEQSAHYFKTPIQQFQFFDKYSRFDYEKGRRETWTETVDRSMKFLRNLSQNKLDENIYSKLRDGILNMKVMPSMRLLAMAGPAAERNNISVYNCSFLGIDSIDAFAEAMYISMAGCGVGYSVESRYVEKMPRVKRQTGHKRPVYVIPDTSEGWMDAIRYGLETWFEGEDVKFDLGQLRVAGTPLKTKGGRASGPEPLKYVLDFARQRVLNRQGSFLRPIDAHDITCAIGAASISGGVRRTALISLFDNDDLEMRMAKHGDFDRENNQRWNANNSAVWDENKSLTQQYVLEYMLDMFKSERGEPGIFSRRVANLTKPERRKEWEFGTNPCSEILLRSQQFCNLTVAVGRKDDTVESMREKVELATILGTIQSLATDFKHLRPEWKANCEEERLLGVDITGQMDCAVVQNADVMQQLKTLAVSVNAEYANILSIAQSAAVTCVKPSGNSSQLLDCSSGLHARHAPYYIRNVRVSSKSPLFKVLRDAGTPMDPENGQTEEDAHTWVVHFPVKAPEGAITRKDRSAIEQCEYWLLNKQNWTEHNPSVTITYKPNEVIDLTKWVWEHKDWIGGISFLPDSDAKYAQMPYEEISEDVYNASIAKFPEIPF